MGNTPFKMKGFSGYGAPFKKADPPVEKLVPHTSPNKPLDYGSSDTSPYEEQISPRTKNLIDANAPKGVIKKSQARDVANFKASQTSKKSPAKAGLKHFTKANTLDRTAGGGGGR